MLKSPTKATTRRQPGNRSPHASRARLTRRRAEAPRIEIIDALRGFALFGILIVNIAYFSTAYINIRGIANPEATSTMDTAITVAAGLFFESKFYVLFAFLFGYSFLLQHQRSDRAGANFNHRMLRRMIGGMTPTFSPPPKVISVDLISLV